MPRSNVPLRPNMLGTTYRITPTGTAATDTQAFSDLVDAITASTKPGVIEVVDNATPLMLDAAVPGHANGKQIMHPIRIKGETPFSTIQQESGYLINWGGYTNNMIPTQSLTGLSYYARGSIQACVAKDTDIVILDSSGTTWAQSAGLAAGDTITLSSLDEIEGADPHITGGQNHPGEIHRVVRVTHDTTTISSVTYARTTVRIADPIADDMTSSPQACKVVMLKNCGIHDITLHTTKGTNVSHTQTTNLSVRRCHAFRMENVYAEKYGTIVFDLATDARVAGYTSMSCPDNQGDYGIAVAACHGFKIQNCEWHDIRHGFTTGGQTVSASAPTYPNHIWGTPSHGVVESCKIYIPGVSGVSWAGLDTHSGGHDIMFRNCDAFVSHKNAVVHAFTSRCRKVRFHRCRVFGNVGDFVTGFVIRGAESEVRECEVEGAWQGVVYMEGFQGGSYSGHKCDESRFSDLYGAAVRVENAVGQVMIRDNRCTKVRRGAASSGYRKTCIDFAGTGTGHEVTGNVINFTDDAGDESVNTNMLTVAQVKLHGNYMLGYGADNMGHYSGLVAPSVTIAAAYKDLNYTD